MRSTVAPSVTTSGLRENRRISVGANANSAPPESIISPISMGMNSAASAFMRCSSFAPYALPSSVAAAVCMPWPGM